MITGKGLLAILILALAMACSSGLAARDRAGGATSQPVDGDSAETVGTGAVMGASSGPFDGYDSRAGTVWIDDFVYTLSPDYRVIGHATRVGLLSAIKEGEVVDFITRPNPKDPSIPYIVEIRRR